MVFFCAGRKVAENLAGPRGNVSLPNAGKGTHRAVRHMALPWYIVARVPPATTTACTGTAVQFRLADVRVVRSRLGVIQSWQP